MALRLLSGSTPVSSRPRPQGRESRMWPQAQASGAGTPASICTHPCGHGYRCSNDTAQGGNPPRAGNACIQAGPSHRPARGPRRSGFRTHRRGDAMQQKKRGWQAPSRRLLTQPWAASWHLTGRWHRKPSYHLPSPGGTVRCHALAPPQKLPCGNFGLPTLRDLF